MERGENKIGERPSEIVKKICPFFKTFLTKKHWVFVSLSLSLSLSLSFSFFFSLVQIEAIQNKHSTLLFLQHPPCLDLTSRSSASLLSSRSAAAGTRGGGGPPSLPTSSNGAGRTRLPDRGPPATSATAVADSGGPSAATRAGSSGGPAMRWKEE